MLRRLFDRLRLPFRKDRELRSALFHILGFYPQNIDYYKIAFAHKSQALRDKNGKPLNNERLEFLGDAVLESVVSDILFHHFEKRHEGFLTATRSKIVQRESLNRLAKDMGIDKLIQTSTRNHSAHSHLGGNAFEALMGAIYLDKGYKTCQKFVQKQILGRLMDLDGVANKEVNFKSKLLEWCQKNKLKQDFIMRLEDSDKQKEPLFHCTVIIEGIEFGYGKGFSKKEAQQQAARETLTMLRRDENVADSVFRAKEKRTAMEANEMAVLPKIDEIEDELLREQQSRVQSTEPKVQKTAAPTPQKPKREKQVAAENKPQPAETKKFAETKKPAATEEPVSTTKNTNVEKVATTEVSKKEKVAAQTAEATAETAKPTPAKKEGNNRQQAEAKETVAQPAPQKKEQQEVTAENAVPQKEKKEQQSPKAKPINVASLAEAAIADAEVHASEFKSRQPKEKKPVTEEHLPSVVEPHSTAMVTKEKHSTAVVATEPHSTAVAVVEPSRKREVAPKTATEEKQQPAEVEQTTKATQPTAVSETTEVEATETVTPENSETKAPKQNKRRHKVTRIAEYSKTEVKSEEEVEAERQRIKEEREEKQRNKRIQREANRAKKDLEKLTQPAVSDHNEVLAEVSLDNSNKTSDATTPVPVEETLSNSAKRRLRRKRAAERAQQANATVNESPATAEETQQAEVETTRPAVRKKHQHGNSRKRRRQQTTVNEPTATPAEA